MGIIYKAQNTVTGHIYIGSTTKSLESRINDHLQKSQKKVGYKFQEAIGTYGPEAFSWEIIDSASTINDLANKEIYYINYFNSFIDGYNSDRGGGFKKEIHQFDLAGNLLYTYNSLEEASNSVETGKKDISRACWSANHLHKGHYWSFNTTENVLDTISDQRKKKVAQLSLNEELIQIFPSASQASRSTGISKTCITRCCRKERENSGGYIWKYI